MDQPITNFVTALTSNPPFALPISTSVATTFTALQATYNGTPSTISPAAINPNFTNELNRYCWL